MNEKIISGGICAAKGFKASGMQVGIGFRPVEPSAEPPKPKKIKNDLGLVYSEKMCTAAAVYTKNKVKGAPILVTQRNISDGCAQAVIVNSKNANTCNADGEQVAEKMCCLAAEALGLSATDIIVASTGVIGQPLNIAPIEANIGKLASLLKYGEEGSDACATAIMTTDTIKKEYAVEFTVGGTTCKMGGIAKGSGMIHPNMATMLCFMTTDAAISAEMIKSALSEVTRVTFNRVSVDGDTSTNDMACVMANGMSGSSEITQKGEDYNSFCSALYTLMRFLSREIARDGEGATKLLECTVTEAPTEDIAETVAKSVITSSLFKSAMFGSDANWGRILCAVGYAEADFDINKVGVTLGSAKGSIEVCRDGSGVEFSEETAKEILLEDEIFISITLSAGSSEATAWGCDLTYDYVKINGDYRS